MRTHRLQNPFEHWFSGLLAELGVMAAFLVFLSAFAAAVGLLTAYLR